jgi:two-component system, cell cycle sensor histidine kinase and response regulator CckA
MTHPSQHGTILVVDDNVDILNFAKRFLEIDGYTVITATDGDEGLRFYEEHQATIVLLLTDVVMPKINGFELADRVQAMDSGKPVLLMSGDAGCNYRDLECLAKPFRPTELTEMVSRVLSGNVQSGKRAASAA